MILPSRKGIACSVNWVEISRKKIRPIRPFQDGVSNEVEMTALELKLRIRPKRRLMRKRADALSISERAD